MTLSPGLCKHKSLEAFPTGGGGQCVPMDPSFPQWLPIVSGAWFMKVGVSKSLPSLSALSLCLFLSVFPLFLYYLQNGNPGVNACACSLQKGKIPGLLHFFTPVSLSPVCHSINLDVELAPRSCPLGTTECDIVWKWSLCRYD